MGIIGGVIAWSVLRNKNPPQARKMLVVGVAVLGVFVVLVAVGMHLDETQMPEGNPDGNDAAEGQSLSEEPSEAEDAEAQLDQLPKGVRLLREAALVYANLLDTIDPADSAGEGVRLPYYIEDMLGRLLLINPDTHMLHDTTEGTCSRLDGAIYVAYSVMEFDRLYEPEEDLSHLSDSEFYDTMTQRALLFLDLSDELYPLVYDNIEAWDRLYVYLADAYNDSGCQQYN